MAYRYLIVLSLLLLASLAAAAPPDGLPTQLTVSYTLTGSHADDVSYPLAWNGVSWDGGVGIGLEPAPGIGGNAYILLGAGGPLGDAGFMDDVIYRHLNQQLVSEYPDGVKVDWPYPAKFYAIPVNGGASVPEPAIGFAFALVPLALRRRRIRRNSHLPIRT